MLARRVARHRVTIAQPEPHARMIRRVTHASRSRLAWCPADYRALYHQLRRNQDYLAGEARAIVEAQIARDLDRYRRTGKLQASTR